jgi:hypothetical protein
MLEVLAELRADIAEIKAKVMAYDILKARVLAGVSVAVVTIGAAFAACRSNRCSLKAPP